MSEYINGGSGILTSIGWVDLKTNRSQKPHCIRRELQQPTVLQNRFLSRQTELWASSDRSRLMGEPPYHLRKSRKCASTWVFATKTHPCFPMAHGNWLQKPVNFGCWAWARREEMREKRFVLSWIWFAFQVYLIHFCEFQLNFTLIWRSKS